MSVFTHLSLSPINIAAALCSAKAYNSAYAKRGNITHPYGYWKDTGVKLTGRAVQNFTMMLFGNVECYGTGGYRL